MSKAADIDRDHIKQIPDTTEVDRDTLESFINIDSISPGRLSLTNFIDGKKAWLRIVELNEKNPLNLSGLNLSETAYICLYPAVTDLTNTILTGANIDIFRASKLKAKGAVVIGATLKNITVEEWQKAGAITTVDELLTAFEVMQKDPNSYKAVTLKKAAEYCLANCLKLGITEDKVKRLHEITPPLAVEGKGWAEKVKKDAEESKSAAVSAPSR